MATRDVVFPQDRQDLYARNRYSPAVRSDGLLFVSGQVGSGEDGSPAPGLENEIARAFANLDAILQAAGCSRDDVVDVTLFLVEPQAILNTVLQAWADYWGAAPYPTLTAVGVTWLYGFQFEIKAIVRQPSAA
ncbi:Rid family hydrolase [Xanthomonas maliensis]|uniref:Rid family hydrolase n=1 Tax=Xanthomonas maliensis TaxID=1321368 RepID=UPI0003A39CEA|nr:Rid family hydrolase [Xanthomonas maliensis]KAB7767052.1 hypothetical protein CKY51_12070 [Xanthomonas maliensis]